MQLATLAMAAGGRSRWAVFLGAAVALVCASAIAVLIGEGLERALPALWLHRGAEVPLIVLWLMLCLGWGGAPPGATP